MKSSQPSSTAAQDQYTWFNKEPYYLPASIPMLIINVHKKGLDNPLVRRALAYSINYALIAQTAPAPTATPIAGNSSRSRSGRR